MQRSESAKWQTHDIHGKKSKPEFTGSELGSITFDMYFSISQGVHPMNEIDKLIQANRKGVAHPLILGTKRFGMNKYYIASINSTFNHTNNKGLVLSAKVNLTMGEYV